MTTLGRIVGAILLGGLILFPGVELLRFLAMNVLGLYHEMSLTDCLLVFVIILLCALLLQQRGGEGASRTAPSKRSELTLMGNKTRDRSRETPSRPRGRKRTREPVTERRKK